MTAFGREGAMAGCCSWTQWSALQVYRALRLLSTLSEKRSAMSYVISIGVESLNALSCRLSKALEVEDFRGQLRRAIWGK